MIRNIRLTIAYDGTDFHGWQKQPELRTVQGDIERALRRVIQHPLNINGSGRTDSGVHAQGQVANFETDSNMSCDAIRRATGSRLAKDISIIHACEVPLGFRCSGNATSKLYRYSIYNDQFRPVEMQRQRYVHHVWTPLDANLMQAAAERMVGEKDFACFATSGREYRTTVRNIFRCEVHRRFSEILIDVEGSGFLYNMVRNMVGTMIEVGRGHWAPEKIDQIIASKNRSEAGPTAPARGLCLQWVKYDVAAFHDQRRREAASSHEEPSDAEPSSETLDDLQ